MRKNYLRKLLTIEKNLIIIINNNLDILFTQLSVIIGLLTRTKIFNICPNEGYRGKTG